MNYDLVIRRFWCAAAGAGICWLAALAAAFSVIAAASAQAPPPLVSDPELSEISGLAASLRTPGWFWVHNDSGNPARLYALDGQGQVRQRVDVRAVNHDWEDIAAFRWHGEPWLAIADTGANLSLRRQATLLLLPEPLPVPEPSSIGVSKAIVFDYPQRMRDVEAMAVDAEAGQILLLEKIRPPTTLFALDLNGPEHQQAQVIATLPDWWPEPDTPVETIADHHYRGAPTAMDLSPDGRRLAVLTPSHWMVFSRQPGESWNAVLQRKPLIGRLRSHEQPWRRTIFEALGWDADGHLRISGERLPAPLLTIDPEPQP